MKLLREAIRRLILEDVCAGATAKIQKGLDEIENRDLVIEVDIFLKGGYDIILRQGRGSNAKTVGQYEVGTSNQSKAAYITMWTDVHPHLQKTGIGAVLYDVAIEVATELGGYLTCDRSTVSEDARRMWAYYNASDDYEAYQLDTPDGHFTPDDPDDDIGQKIFYRAERKTLGKYMVGDPAEYKNDFMASPFTKAYKKKRITTIPCLGDRYSEIS